MENSSQVNNCYNSIHCNFLFVNNYNLSSVSQNVLKFYQQLPGEERRIPFIFDDFHFCRFRVIGLDMTENRIVTQCHMITWVVFLRMFWNFISSLLVKRGGSLSFLVGTVIIRHRVKILFSVMSSPITLEWQKWKSSKMKGILLSSPVNSW
jgi:hypothetical protein